MEDLSKEDKMYRKYILEGYIRNEPFEFILSYDDAHTYSNILSASIAPLGYESYDDMIKDLNHMFIVLSNERQYILVYHKILHNNLGNRFESNFDPGHERILWKSDKKLKGEVHRFTLGYSDGFIPFYLELNNKRSKRGYKFEWRNCDIELLIESHSRYSSSSRYRRTGIVLRLDKLLKF